MEMKKIKNKEIKDYVNGLTDFQKEIVLAIREVVLNTDERMQEDIKWGSIAFFNKKNICGFRVAKAHITLLFMEGASLKNSDGLLKGDGVKARTYKIVNLNEINKKALKFLVSEALDLGL